eukprot:CAMPEP_0184310270 /NCGR_PEP_ID=MMETSP1049-20130417/26751_1 /TAXON_ID=77928 /ORGANISM="Proteomonas sulcata, Strain CCMP704" /LENGTH=77 /DNA_ID=CAMNT_0026624117 /DNA_START=179 /DNA_END=412 /DNA_ORIENTATION=+
MFLFPGLDSHSYSVGATAPWQKVTTLAAAQPSAHEAAVNEGGLATGYYAGFSAGKKAGSGLDGVIAGATAAYYKFHH